MTSTRPTRRTVSILAAVLALCAAGCTSPGTGPGPRDYDVQARVWQAGGAPRYSWQADAVNRDASRRAYRLNPYVDP